MVQSPPGGSGSFAVRPAACLEDAQLGEEALHCTLPVVSIVVPFWGYLLGSLL